MVAGGWGEVDEAVGQGVAGVGIQNVQGTPPSYNYINLNPY